MVTKIRKQDVRKLVGKDIVALRKDGTAVSGKLVSIKGDTLQLAPKKGKSVQTKAIIPLVLFDLLAVGTSPYAYGGYGGYGGYGYGGYPGGYPYGGFGYGGGFW
ncbi:hypothetical protein D3C73_459020 [compost metagenome]